MQFTNNELDALCALITFGAIALIYLENKYHEKQSKNYWDY